MKNQFLHKMKRCPIGFHFCGYSEGDKCLIFANEQMIQTEKIFDCNAELKKLNKKPRRLKDVSLGLFD